MTDSRAKPAAIELFSVPLFGLRRGLALAWLRAWLSGGQGRAIFTVNPEFIVAARSDREFLKVLQHNDLNLIDGTGLLIAARWHGHRRCERLPGIELVSHICQLCIAGNYPLFLLGGRDGTAAAAAAALVSRHPGLRVAGAAEPDDPFGQAESICRMIAASGARVLLVAFGTPRQEYWITRNLPHCHVRLAVGVGGAFDMISGRVRRAPRWVRRIGLEWLFRLVIQPWRWRRQRILPIFLGLAARSALQARFGRSRLVK